MNRIKKYVGLSKPTQLAIVYKYNFVELNFFRSREMELRGMIFLMLILWETSLICRHERGFTFQINSLKLY